MQQLKAHIINKEQRITVNTLGVAENIFRQYWGASNIRLREQSAVLHLKNDYTLIGIQKITVGSLTKTMCDDSLIIASALLLDTKYIVHAHNHPSDKTSPSENDIKSYHLLKKRAAFFGITLLDDIIIGINTLSSISK